MTTRRLTVAKEGAQEMDQGVVVRSRPSTTREKVWSRLPDIILDRVFSYLPSTDQQSASHVCRQWSRAFDNPDLWRKLVVDMEDSTMDSLQRVVQNAKRYGHHMRHLQIIYNRTRLYGNPELERPLIALIDTIYGRTQLTHFNLQYFTLNRGNRASSILAHKFLNSVCWLLRTQHTLSEVVMGRSFYNSFNQGNHILQAIAKGSGISLRKLVLLDFFRQNQAVFGNEKYLQVLGRFKRLEAISLNYNCVSAEVVRRLAQNCAGSFRSLDIVCDGNEDPIQTLDDQVWKQLRRDCPNVTVDFTIVGLDDLEMLKRLVPSQMPLRRLRYETFMLEDDDTGPIEFVAYVLTTFQNTLEDLELDFDESVPMVGTCTLLKEFLPSLTKLTSLDIEADVPDTFIDEVNAMQEQKLINRLSKFRVEKCKSSSGAIYVFALSLGFISTTGKLYGDPVRRLARFFQF